jgi:ribosomal-protein-serine acetyltransferase
MTLDFSALHGNAITLHRITEANFKEVLVSFSGFADSESMLSELKESYYPQYDPQGRQILFGFYATLQGKLAGGSLLGISSWPDARGYTGADTLAHMRGQGIAPKSKPHLFCLGFELLGLNRIETGCLVSNTASRRSIEKTPGFEFEGTLREYARNPQGIFEDEYRYAILKRDWLRLYDRSYITVVGVGSVLG